jgi:hypothetical protein
MSDMVSDPANIAQRGEELRYYYERLLGNPVARAQLCHTYPMWYRMACIGRLRYLRAAQVLLTSETVHSVLGVDHDRVDMATQAARLLTHLHTVEANAEALRSVFSARAPRPHLTICPVAWARAVTAAAAVPRPTLPSLTHESGWEKAQSNWTSDRASWPGLAGAAVK